MFGVTFKLLWILLMASGAFWGFGFLFQRLANSPRSHTEGKCIHGLWVYVLGLTPGRDCVYLFPLILQVTGLIAFILGLVGVWQCDEALLRRILRYVLSSGIVVMLAAMFVRELRSKKKK